MAEGKISIYTGTGRGKTPAALGTALRRASRGDSVIVILFLKGKGFEESEFLRRLEPEIKFFRFEKSDIPFDQRSEEEKQEDRTNIMNGLNFARKVLTTSECDLLVLDEVLGLVDNGILSARDLKTLLDCRKETDVVLTGITMKDELYTFADEITRMETEQFKAYN
ncbi:MAG: cob(I)yrinic acid a,c-diamide adenosyltransferase [Lachnospiraceae bacterium]|jgi:cob(I)alamin adenosyltransferase|nr:cob(I)yrinic acid a,c-diamide adenosyltransferase [Lachnospiraceae bacterium]